MKFILYFLLLKYTIACSSEVKKEQSLEKEMIVIESPSVNTSESQISTTQEHISGKGETHISGGSPSSHISGQ